MQESGTQDARPADSPDDLVDALAQTAFVVTAVISRVAAENDLSLTQFRVLAILRDRRLRMSELADFLGLEKSTLSGLVDRAAKRGLMQRAPSDTDGRSIEVFLTPTGTALTRAVYPEVVTILTPLTRALAPADRRRLTALLSTLLEAGPSLSAPNH